MIPVTSPSPLSGEHSAHILARLRELRHRDAPTHGGRVLSYVYDSGCSELDDLAAEAMRLVQPLNGLDPTTFTSVGVMEREVLSFARNMMHGDATVVGTVTSGGTESCLLAVKIARDHYRTVHGREVVPTVVAPSTCHAAFHKAAHYLGVELVLVPVDPSTGITSAESILAACDERTALIVVSAPAYPHGVMDPIASVAQAAAPRNIPVHVDACIGGWVLPFWETPSGGTVPAWDFALPGVTSISADAHKYGYAPKGVSVLMVRGRDYQRHQLFATTQWPGYPVVNPTFAGSKSAAPLAAIWAITQALGVEGYRELTRRCMEATAQVRAAIAEIPGLRILGDPTGPLLAIAADDDAGPHRVDPHLWADALRGLGWGAQGQPGYSQSDHTSLPPTTHVTITPVTLQVSNDLCTAMVTAGAQVRGQRRPEPAQVLLHLAESMGTDPEHLTAMASAPADQVWHLLQSILGGAEVNRDQASLLALLEACPPALAERLLIELIARTTQPQ